jgi:hypothetical protein
MEKILDFIKGQWLNIVILALCLFVVSYVTLHVIDKQNDNMLTEQIKREYETKLANQKHYYNIAMHESMVRQQDSLQEIYDAKLVKSNTKLATVNVALDAAKHDLKQAWLRYSNDTSYANCKILVNKQQFVIVKQDSALSEYKNNQNIAFAKITSLTTECDSKSNIIASYKGIHNQDSLLLASYKVNQAKLISRHKTETFIYKAITAVSLGTALVLSIKR